MTDNSNWESTRKWHLPPSLLYPFSPLPPSIILFLPVFRRTFQSSCTEHIQSCFNKQKLYINVLVDKIFLTINQFVVIFIEYNFCSIKILSGFEIIGLNSWLHLLTKIIHTDLLNPLRLNSITPNWKTVILLSIALVELK